MDITTLQATDDACPMSTHFSAAAVKKQKIVAVRNLKNAIHFRPAYNKIFNIKIPSEGEEIVLRNLLMMVALLCAFIANVHAVQTPEERKAAFAALDWHEGPQTENIASKATLTTRAGLAFLDDKNTREFLKLTGNIPEPDNFLLLSKDENWWAVFSFNPSGYVKDDEKIDADALLKTLKDSDGPANEERKKLGIAALYTEGWYVPPHYDQTTKRLEWGVKLRSGNDIVLNYTIRLLGRTGVMNATLVSSPETLDADVKSFKATFPGFEFNPGERYAEFKSGDRIAEFGLGALVVGGAAAIATKKGFWAAIASFLAVAWKFLAVGAAAMMSWIVSLFKRKS